MPEQPKLIPQSAPVAPSDSPQPPEFVSHGEFIAAIEPLLKLVGTDAMSIFTEGFVVTQTEIRFVTAVPVPDVEPIVVGDEDKPEWQEYGWPVTVTVSF